MFHKQTTHQSNTQLGLTRSPFTIKLFMVSMPKWAYLKKNKNPPLLPENQQETVLVYLLLIPELQAIGKRFWKCTAKLNA